MADETSTTEENCFRLTGEVDGIQFTFDLVDGEHIAGSSNESDIEIVMPGVSRQHAKLSVADGTLENLTMDCRVSFEACAWVPLAEWVLGQALSSIGGREDEARTVLARAADQAPGTWIATSLTQ